MIPGSAMTRSEFSWRPAAISWVRWRTCCGRREPSRCVVRPRDLLRCRVNPSLRSGRLALVLLVGLCSACDFYYYRVPSPDDLWRIIPWFDHMIHARYIRPYETHTVPRNTPDGSVPVSGSEPDWSAEW